MDSTPVVRVAYPVNLVPVPGQDGVADGHLRPAEGITSFATGQGADRGGIVWTGAGLNVHYRISGTKLISVSAAGVVVVIGDVGGSGPARMDFSFDQLGILSGGFLWYYTVGGGLIKQTNVNIPANLIDMCWVDGYWVVTDGEFIAVSDLAAPSTFNPLKVGSTDRPDPIQCLLKVLNELHVVSRNFIDVFQNVGGSLFPFQRVSTAVITKGTVGLRGACVFNDTVAFVGNGRNEAPSVYLGRSGQSVPITTVEIDKLLESYTTAELSAILTEAVFTQGGQYLFIHLPDRAIVYDAVMSAKAQQPVWHIRTSAIAGFSQYRAQNMVRANDVWVVGDPQSSAIGILSVTDAQHYGLPNRWEFSTLMLRTGGTGATMHSLELLGLTGVVAFGADPMISTASSTDGVNFGTEQSIRSGRAGERAKRMRWFKQGTWKSFRIQRVRGDSGSRLSPLSLDADISPLAF